MKVFGRMGLLLLLAVLAWGGGPGELVAQCYNCSLELNEDGSVKTFGCSPSERGGAVCETHCEKGKCECTPEGACGISQGELVGDGTVFVVGGSGQAVMEVESEGRARSVRSCNATIVQRRYDGSAARGMRRETATVVI